MSNLLPLDLWRQHLGFMPWHFWGWGNNTKIPVDSACNDVLMEYSWQHADRVGRAEIREAIETAESKLRSTLLYSVAPRFEEFIVRYPQYQDARQHLDIPVAPGDLSWLTVQLPEGHIHACGVERLTAISNVAVVLTDADGDGLNETFTLGPIATTVTDVNEIAVYFAAADRLNGDPAGDTYRIEPIKVTIAGGFVTITGHSWMLARPILRERVGVAPLDPDTAANFAATLDVYRRWVDPDGQQQENSQGVLIWETTPDCDCAALSSYSTDPATVAQGVARVGIRDAIAGVVTPALAARNATTGNWYWVDSQTCKAPQRAKIRTYAGYPLVNRQMAPQFHTIVARLAAAELGRPTCSCQSATRELGKWQWDMTRIGGANAEQYGTSLEIMNCPFGTLRGQVDAWRQIRELRLLRGIAVG